MKTWEELSPQEQLEMTRDPDGNTAIDRAVEDLRPTEKTIPIAEIFGPTIQGEGLLAGRPTYFVRVGGCDFSCQWCDSDHAVNAAKVRGLPRLTQEQIWWALNKQATEHPGPDWVAISGGNPGLYDLGEVVSGWQQSGQWFGQRRVTVETQGSRWQPWFDKVNALTISPKPPSSGMENKTLDAFVAALGEAQDDQQRQLLYDPGIPRDYFQAVLKCIVFDETDYKFARELHVRWPLIPFYLSTGTAMGGLSGRWVPPPIPDLGEDEHDRFKDVRRFPDTNWTHSVYLDNKDHLLRRYRWLVERMMNDPLMSDAAVFPQIHVLLWGVTTRGV